MQRYTALTQFLERNDERQHEGLAADGALQLYIAALLLISCENAVVVVVLPEVLGRNRARGKSGLERVLVDDLGDGDEERVRSREQLGDGGR